MKLQIVLFHILLICLLASCLPVGTAAPSTAQPITPATVEESPMPETHSAPEPAALQLAQKAREDLALRLTIPANEITISSVQAVTWPDSSLGCPQPGMAYLQVLTPGYLILLEAGGNVYEYHAGRSSTVISCQNPEPPVPGAPADI